MVHRVVRRLQNVSAVLAGTIVSDGDVAPSHRNFEPQPPTDMVPEFYDARQTHLETRGPQDTLSILGHYDGAVLKVEANRPLPANERDGKALRVEN